MKYVIGNSLAALICAYTRKLPIVLTGFDPPFEYEYFRWRSSDALKALFGLNREQMTFNGENCGCSKRKLYTRLYLALTMTGQAPFSHRPITKVKINQRAFKENSFEVFYENGSKTAKYSNLLIFDDPDKIEGITTSRELVSTRYVDFFTTPPGLFSFNVLKQFSGDLTSIAVAYKSGHVYSISNVIQDPAEYLPVFCAYKLGVRLASATPSGREIDYEAFTHIERKEIYKYKSSYKTLYGVELQTQPDSYYVRRGYLRSVENHAADTYLKVMYGK